MTKIKKVITAFAVKNDQAEPSGTPDINPDKVKLESRPEGVLAAETNKLVMYTTEGKLNLYISVSYMKLRGTIDGEEVMVERAVECFLPANQRNIGPEAHWIAPLMKLLSYTFRMSGNVAQVLRELRDTEWTKGPVRCGKSHISGKPLQHDSMAAAVGWGFSEMLRQRGLLDDEYAHIPAAVRAGKNFHVLKSETLGKKQPEIETPTQSISVGTCPDKRCQDDLVLRDNCPTCPSCGWSKCS